MTHEDEMSFGSLNWIFCGLNLRFLSQAWFIRAKTFRSWFLFAPSLVSPWPTTRISSAIQYTSCRPSRTLDPLVGLGKCRITMALLIVWLGSRQSHTLVLPSGRTFSQTFMLLHKLVGASFSSVFCISPCHQALPLLSRAWLLVLCGHVHDMELHPESDGRVDPQFQDLQSYPCTLRSVYLSGGGLVVSCREIWLLRS